jgi:hypothetical protein
MNVTLVLGEILEEPQGIIHTSVVIIVTSNKPVSVAKQNKYSVMYTLGHTTQSLHVPDVCNK